MRKVFGIILYVHAGFFINMANLLAFMNFAAMGEGSMQNDHSGTKWIGLAVCTVIAILFLLGGLAVNRFQNWQRHSGIVLVTVAAATCFMIFTVWCMGISDEFKQVMPPNVDPALFSTMYNAYLSGFGLLIGTALLGMLLLKTGKAKS